MQDPEEVEVEVEVVIEDDYDDDEDPWDDPNSESLYLKYMFEGIPTLSDLATSLRALADDLDERVAAGWRIEGPVDSGWVHIRRTW